MSPRHDGSPLPAGLSFPIAPSPSIGEVLSADTNVPVGDGAMGRLFRGMGSGSHCSYVGREGVQRWTQGSFGAPTEVVVRFVDVDRLSVERSRLSYGGSYTKSVLTAHFRRAPKSVEAFTEGDDDPIATWKTEHYQADPATVPSDPYAQFIHAVERSWNAYVLPRLLAELETTGAVVFRATRGYFVRVGRDELAAGYPGKVIRNRARREVSRVWIENGRVLVEPPLGTHPEVAGADLGNFPCFLAVLDAAGYRR
jgi:hypothetical protein